MACINSRHVNRRLEHLGILVSAGVLETVPYVYRETIGIVNFERVKICMRIFSFVWGLDAPNTHIVQGSTGFSTFP